MCVPTPVYASYASNSLYKYYMLTTYIAIMKADERFGNDKLLQ